MNRRDNGLDASHYAPLVDVDPPVADHILALLADAGVAAYALPHAGEVGPYQDVHPPNRPTDRVFVDRAETATAQAVVVTSLPTLRAEFLALGAASEDRHELRAQEVDEAWARIMAGYELTVDHPGEPSPDGPPPDDRPKGLSARLIRRTPPSEPPTTGKQDADDDEVAGDDPDVPESQERTLTGRDWIPLVDPLEQVDRFVPPTPPPLPRGDRISRAAWAGVLLGPLLVILGSAVNLGPSPWVSGLGLVGFVGGFGTLVYRMSDGPRDGDDGAVV